MKKYLLLLVGLTIIACSSDDDNEPGSTTDPFIGTWRTAQGGDTGTMIINSNGSGTINYTYEEFEDETTSFTWTNAGSDFTSLIQVYTLTGTDGEGSDTVSTESVRFAPDFNSWQDAELVEEDNPDVWIRQ